MPCHSVSCAWCSAVPSLSCIKQMNGLFHAWQSVTTLRTADCPLPQHHTAPDLNACQICFRMFHVSEANCLVVRGLLYFILCLSESQGCSMTNLSHNQPSTADPQQSAYHFSQSCQLLPNTNKVKYLMCLTLWSCSWTFTVQHTIYVKCEYFMNQEGNIGKYTTFCGGINEDGERKSKKIIKYIYWLNI